NVYFRHFTDLSIGAPAGTQPASHPPERKRSTTGKVISNPVTIKIETRT
ncbi:hypothetical protein A2U01_0067291, partial [Trifolium medium]|nr:hypothetical protein [Trifolium medium]